MKLFKKIRGGSNDFITKEKTDSLNVRLLVSLKSTKLYLIETLFLEEYRYYDCLIHRKYGLNGFWIRNREENF